MRICNCFVVASVVCQVFEHLFIRCAVVVVLYSLRGDTCMFVLCNNVVWEQLTTGWRNLVSGYFIPLGSMLLTLRKQHDVYVFSDDIYLLVNTPFRLLCRCDLCVTLRIYLVWED